VWIAFPLAFQGILWDFLLQKAIDRTHQNLLWTLTFTLLSALGASLPVMLSAQLVEGVFTMFVPLTGRSGSLLPPDLAIGGIAAALVCLICPYMVGVYGEST